MATLCRRKDKMAGLWLENGLNLQIQNSLAEELAEEIQKNGSAEFLGSKI